LLQFVAVADHGFGEKVGLEHQRVDRRVEYIGAPEHMPEFLDVFVGTRISEHDAPEWRHGAAQPADEAIPDRQPEFVEVMVRVDLPRGEYNVETGLIAFDRQIELQTVGHQIVESRALAQRVSEGFRVDDVVPLVADKVRSIPHQFSLVFATSRREDK